MAADRHALLPSVALAGLNKEDKQSGQMEN